MKNDIDIKEKLKDNEKLLLNIEWVLGAFSFILFFGAIYLASSGILPIIWSTAVGVLGFILFAVGISCCLKIEQTAGYYECSKCGNKYVPTFKSVLCGMHYGRTWYLKCPKCGEKSWQKKVLS